MWTYTFRRLLLLPFTLFFIVIINFIIINLAPGEPFSYTEISPQGNASQKGDRPFALNSDERYLHFREFYGLTLPILFNTWPELSSSYVEKTLWQLVHHQFSVEDKEEINGKKYTELRITFGDQSRFIMPHLLSILDNNETPKDIRWIAAHFFVRGGARPAFVGPSITPEQKSWNKQIALDDQLLHSFLWPPDAPLTEIKIQVEKMKDWFNQNRIRYGLTPTFWEKITLFIFETRLVHYLYRVMHLDFGTLRNDSSKTVISEVAKRFKYSLTLAIIPMFITFGLCQFFGFLMAYYQKQWPDYLFNFLFLILYAIPVFVVAPFLIENIALHHCFPFSHTPIPISGFTSPDRVYNQQLSYQRLFDIFQHIALPLLAIMYGSLASEARLSRTAVLEVLRQDYIRTARAKGVPPAAILFKHVGRNAAITVITSLAGSLGVILGGSLIVETLFDINGFGKFFYDAVINRDYNVIMFSALAGSFLTLVGYLLADLAYMWLDPRITLD